MLASEERPAAWAGSGWLDDFLLVADGYMRSRYSILHVFPHASVIRENGVPVAVVLAYPDEAQGVVAIQSLWLRPDLATCFLLRRVLRVVCEQWKTAGYSRLVLMVRRDRAREAVLLERRAGFRILASDPLCISLVKEIG